MVKISGQAYTKDERWLYTWFDDGTVYCQLVHRGGEGTTMLGSPEPVHPRTRWNDEAFLAFVPVDENANDPG